MARSLRFFLQKQTKTKKPTAHFNSIQVNLSIGTLGDNLEAFVGNVNEFSLNGTVSGKL